MAKNDDNKPEVEIKKPDPEVTKAEVEVKKPESTEGLVKVFKNGETLFVNPSTLAAHQEQGWKLA